MDKLDITHDVATQMAKMIEATNEIVNLTKQLISAGQALNDVKGKYTEIKAKIKAQKEIINSLKVVIRAENNTSGGF
jgi:hypothetical protein